jgi:putative FmdB family regulatory protein
MPIYEYHCRKCGNFETMQKMSDKPLTQCPTCRRKVTKLISSTSFQLKGSGWYITDYARKGDAGGAKSDKKGDDKKSDDKKSETKGAEATTDSSSASDSGSGTAKTSDKGSSKKSEKAAVA